MLSFGSPTTTRRRLKSGRGGYTWTALSYSAACYADTSSELAAALEVHAYEIHPVTDDEKAHSRKSRTGVPPKTGRTGLMQRGELWFAATPGGDRPVLILTRDPVADRIGAVVVAALTRTRRGLVSELELTAADDVPTDCVVNFDNIHTLSRDAFRRKIGQLSAGPTPSGLPYPAGGNRLLAAPERVSVCPPLSDTLSRKRRSRDGVARAAGAPTGAPAEPRSATSLTPCAIGTPGAVHRLRRRDRRRT